MKGSCNNMRLYVKDALLTETTTKKLLEDLSMKGITKEEAKVLVKHSEIKKDYSRINMLNLSMTYMNIEEYYIEVADDIYTLLPDADGVIYTIGEEYKEEIEDMKLNVNINTENLQAKIEELQSVLSRAKEIEDYPINAELTIDEEALKEWITEDIHIEEVNAYADNETIESVITIHF